MKLVKVQQGSVKDRILSLLGLASTRGCRKEVCRDLCKHKRLGIPGRPLEKILLQYCSMGLLELPMPSQSRSGVTVGYVGIGPKHLRG